MAEIPTRPTTPLDRWALHLSRLGLAVIVAVAFATSFDAVAAVAADRGAVSEDLAWAVPLAIDGLVVVASSIAWVESLRDGRWHLFPAALVAAAGLLSVVANVAHAESADPLTMALAAVPPVALLASVELGAWQLRRDHRRHARTPSPRGAQQPSTDEPDGQPPRTATNGGVRLDELVPDLDTYRALVERHGGVTAAAEALGTRRQRLGERRRQLEQSTS